MHLNDRKAMLNIFYKVVNFEFNVWQFLKLIQLLNTINRNWTEIKEYYDKNY
jgi:hypothetical protein